MKKYNKQAPIILGDDIVQNALVEVYDDLNKLMNQLYELSAKSDDFKKGKEGQLRVVEHSEKSVTGKSQYIIQAYTKDGWKETSILTDKVK